MFHTIYTNPGVIWKSLYSLRLNCQQEVDITGKLRDLAPRVPALTTLAIDSPTRLDMAFLACFDGLIEFAAFTCEEVTCSSETFCVPTLRVLHVPDTFDTHVTSKRLGRGLPSLVSLTLLEGRWCDTATRDVKRRLFIQELHKSGVALERLDVRCKWLEESEVVRVIQMSDSLLCFVSCSLCFYPLAYCTVDYTVFVIKLETPGPQIFSSFVLVYFI